MDSMWNFLGRSTIPHSGRPDNPCISHSEKNSRLYRTGSLQHSMPHMFPGHWFFTSTHCTCISLPRVRAQDSIIDIGRGFQKSTRDRQKPNMKSIFLSHWVLHHLYHTSIDPAPAVPHRSKIYMLKHQKKSMIGNLTPNTWNISLSHLFSSAEMYIRTCHPTSRNQNNTFHTHNYLQSYRKNTQIYNNIDSIHHHWEFALSGKHIVHRIFLYLPNRCKWSRRKYLGPSMFDTLLPHRKNILPSSSKPWTWTSTNTGLASWRWSQGIPSISHRHLYHPQHKPHNHTHHKHSKPHPHGLSAPLGTHICHQR